MTTLVLDTHKIVTRLQKKGYTKEQAEGFVEAIQEINLDEIASKEDIALLKSDIKASAAEIKYEILKWMIPLFLGLYALNFKMHF